MFSSICYKFEDILIDPGDEWEGIEWVNQVFLTHAHFDHIYGLNKVIELNPEAKVYTNDAGKNMLLNSRLNMSFYNDTEFTFNYPDNIVLVKNGDEIQLHDNLVAKVVFTPGHNPSCITWIIDDCLFTGDSYIPGIKTITNLPGGNKELSKKSICLIESISRDRIIYPGHRL